MSHFFYKSLPYQEDMRSTYQKLSHLPGFVLLESSDGARGRFDILSAFPYDRFSVDANDRDWFKAIRTLESKIPKDSSEATNLPFQGGAIGFVSYDFGERMIGINSTPLDNLRNCPLLEFGFYDWAMITDHHLKKVILFAANRIKETKDVIEQILDSLQNQDEKKKDVILDGQFQALISEQQYKKSFQSIHQFIQQGRSYQVNYTQPFTCHYKGNSWKLYYDVCQRNPVPFSAFLKMEGMELLSFSPERYLLMDQGHLLASPIKGTIRRSSNPKEDEELKTELQNCDKNRAENVMIVDLLRNDLGRIAKPGSVNVTSLCEVQSFNSVHHLVSDIRAECQDSISILQAFMSCFPCGSITGAPKIEAMKMIHEHESRSRGVYCGSIAYFSAHGRFDSNVAIRTVTAKNNVLHLAAGGALVIDSECSSEYRECFTKIKAITNGF